MHAEKIVDEILSDCLHAARATIYHEVAEQWLGGIERVLVVVDGSDVTRQISGGICCAPAYR